FAIYFLGKELFGAEIAILAALLWTFDINSIALGRLAKEDILVTLFFLMGNYFLLKGKRHHFDQPEVARKAYLACGTSFGLLLASKYLIPFPWITLIYYDFFRFR